MADTTIYKAGKNANKVAAPIESVRGSVIVMVWQLILFLIFTDTVYTLINTFLMRVYFLKFVLPFDLHHKIFLLLALLHIGKSVAQIGFIITIVLHWIGRSYYIVEKHLVKRQGVFSIKEKTYDLGNIRSVTVKRSLLGKLLHFGDVVIETSASGGYMDKIVVTGIANPENFEAKLRHYF